MGFSRLLLIQHLWFHDKHANSNLQDVAYEEAELSTGNVVRTGQKVSRLNLVLDCLSPHDFCSHSHSYVNLQQYVIKEKKLIEQESLSIFREIVRVVNNLHQVTFLYSFNLLYSIRELHIPKQANTILMLT